MTTPLQPCLPETYVVEVNPQASEGFTRTPIVGWIMEDNRPLPMTLNGKHTLVGGSAVLFPGGYVENPSFGLAFESTEAWLESNPTEPKHRAANLGPAQKSHKVGEEKPTKTGSAYQIDFSGKPFKSNSWWHYDDGEYEFVFQVDGGENTPKPTKKCEKIKRVDFQDLKKTLDVLDLSDIIDGHPIELDNEDEDFEADEDEDEDDDGDDLI